MAWNGSGVFSRVHSWAADLLAGIKVTAYRMDAEMDGMATGISNCIAKDGQSTINSNIPFNDKRLTGLGNYVADGDALNKTSGDSLYYKIKSLNAQTGTSYTLILTDAGKTVSMSNAAANTLTVPPNSAVLFPNTTVILIRQQGAGQTSIVAGSGVTIDSSGSKLKIRSRYSMAYLEKIDTNEWALAGDISA